MGIKGLVNNLVKGKRFQNVFTKKKKKQYEDEQSLSMKAAAGLHRVRSTKETNKIDWERERQRNSEIKEHKVQAPATSE